MVMGYGGAYHADNMLVGSTIAGGITGIGVGLALREVVDPMVATPFLTGKSTTPPPGVKTLGNFASPSFLGSAIGAGIGLGFGAEGAFRGRIVKSRNTTGFLLGMGSTFAANAVYSAAMPNPTWSNLVAKDPSNPLTTRIQIAPRPAQTQQQLAQSLIT